MPLELAMLLALLEPVVAVALDATVALEPVAAAPAEQPAALGRVTPTLPTC